MTEGLPFAPMASHGNAPASASAVLARLLARFDASVFDIPGGRPRVRLAVRDDDGAELCWDVLLTEDPRALTPASARTRPDALLSAGLGTWRRIADDVGAGMLAYHSGGLRIRQNLHLAIGLLAATAAKRPGRLEVRCVRTAAGRLSTLQAGAGEPVVMLHGLGATKASFLPTIAALAPSFRVIALDLPGFGDASKPLGAAYDAPFFARAVVDALDGLGIRRAHLVGHSLGGRVALEVGMRAPERLLSLTLMTPSLAWRRPRPWAPYLRLVRPELGAIQLVPRAIADPVVRRLVPNANDGWGAVAVDEFLRGFLDPRGRAAFYAAARSIYLEEPAGPDGFWERLRTVRTPAMFIWGQSDRLVPVAFAHHVRAALPGSEHVVLDGGHVPQLEQPAALHAAMRGFIGAQSAARTAPLSARA
jgi:pimeloyl-ACP methyl ester carboxylesterase